ncbi:sensor histidine kinase [Paenibacillus sp. NPDC058174]|uniref:sensor histidine kinase n=1 Tax=Paenibacillus sp. NPDC058174 TaxID=3346366 RepID=UPI0036D91FB3
MMLKQMKQHSRKIILSIILLCIMAETSIPQHPAAGIIPAAAASLIYLTVLWLPDERFKPRTRSVIVIGTWLLMAIYCIWFNAWGTAIAFSFFMTGYSAFRLPFALSVGQTALFIAGNAVIFYTHEVSYDNILLYSVMHAGIYLLFWNARIRRDTNLANKKHYEELQSVYAELEQAHAKLQHTHQELEDATVHLLRYAVVEERSRISRDLHDSIGHGLTSVIVQLQALPYMMKMDAPEAERSLQTVLEVARRCLQDVRSVVRQMAVDEAGLGLVALESLVKQVREQASLSIELSATAPDAEWPVEISELLYRILQEALTNVIRHANASRVDVAISEEEGVLTMTVTDNGGWTAASPLTPGFGMSSMEARCERAGGMLRIEQAASHGMRLIVQVPLAVEAGEAGGERDE